jgi:hypothetical protein
MPAKTLDADALSSGLQMKLLSHPRVIAATSERGREHQTSLFPLVLLPRKKDCG